MPKDKTVNGEDQPSKNLGQSYEESGFDNLTRSMNASFTEAEEAPKTVKKGGFAGLTPPHHNLTSYQSNSSTDSTSAPNLDTAVSPQTFDPDKQNEESTHLVPLKKLAGLSTSAPPTPLQLDSTRNSAQHRPSTITRRASETSLGAGLGKATKKYIITAAKWAYSPISYSQKRDSKRKRDIKGQPLYSIEYSVFRPIRRLPRISNEKELLDHWKLILDSDEVNHYVHNIHNNQHYALAKPSSQKGFDEQLHFPSNHITEEEFNRLIESIIHSIEVDNISPERISQGSSGSYFICNKQVVEFNIETIEKTGIFKPKDEEPYGPLSPKWTKWLHRTFFPCFFGRSCLIPNLGYISETAASVLDECLLSYIVPHTDIIFLKSSTFYYSYWDRHSKTLPEKIGSFQLFLKGYIDAQSWFKLHPIPTEVTYLPESSDIEYNEATANENHDDKFRWSQNSLQQFREELEKLVILDYIMRNTDRGLDNWMIKIEWKVIEYKTRSHQTRKKLTPFIKIGAIDSGLAFPWKHPDEWRSFPFGWLFLPLSVIGQPFSTKTRNHYLPLLTSRYWWETTVVRLKSVFQKDSDFKERMWLKQLAVLKGQAFNVVEILKLAYAGPLELTRRENLLIWDDVMNVPVLVDNDIMINAMESSIYDISYPPKNANHYRKNLDNRINTIIESDGLEDEDEDEEDEAESDKINDSTPLLGNSKTNSKPQLIPKNNNDGLGSVYSSFNDPPLSHSMSGFEYAMACEHQDQGDDEAQLQVSSSTENLGGGLQVETDTKRVIIERLEKVNTKPPVFTWC